MDVKPGPNVQPARLRRESSSQSGLRARRQVLAPTHQNAKRPSPVSDIPFPNPLAICRKGHDGWTILVNPDMGTATAVNRTGALIWKLANGRRTVADITAGVRRRFPDAPDSLRDDVTAMLATLSQAGLIGREIPNVKPRRTRSSRRRTMDDALPDKGRCRQR